MSRAVLPQTPIGVNMGCPLASRGLALRGDCGRCTGEPAAATVRLKRGEILYLEGDPAEHLYLTVEGLLRETRDSADGRSQGIRLIYPGELAGTEAFVRGEYQCSVEAMADSRLCRVPAREARAVLAQSPEQGWALAQVLATEILSLREQIVTVGLLSAEERVSTTLTALTRAATRGAWTRLPLTRQELAGLLGLTQATVSRVFQRLARRGALEVRGRWVRPLG